MAVAVSAQGDPFWHLEALCSSCYLRGSILVAGVYALDLGGNGQHVDDQRQVLMCRGGGFAADYDG